jgi:hypothetical protein
LPLPFSSMRLLGFCCSGMARRLPNSVPDDEKVCSGWDLALVLGKTQLPEDEARAWHRDLRAARKTLKSPGDKWRSQQAYYELPPSYERQLEAPWNDGSSNMSGV